MSPNSDAMVHQLYMPSSSTLVDFNPSDYVVSYEYLNELIWPWVKSMIVPLEALAIPKSLSYVLQTWGPG